MFKKNKGVNNYNVVTTYAEVGLSFPEKSLMKSACDTDIVTSDFWGESPFK